MRTSVVRLLVLAVAGLGCIALLSACDDGEPQAASGEIVGAEDALFQEFGSASPGDWKGECDPPDGSGLQAHESCHVHLEQRGNTIQYAFLTCANLNRCDPGPDRFIVYVRFLPEGWEVISEGLCSGDCPWPP